MFTSVPPPKKEQENDPGKCYATVNSLPVEASDNCDTVSIASDHESKQFNVGKTDVTYTATDSSGNSVVAKQEVTVVGMYTNCIAEFILER